MTAAAQSTTIHSPRSNSSRPLPIGSSGPVQLDDCVDVGTVVHMDATRAGSGALPAEPVTTGNVTRDVDENLTVLDEGSAAAGLTIGSGPWEQAFVCSIGTPVRSKSNFRRYNRRNVGDRDRWAAFKHFEALLAHQAQTVLPDGWDLGDATKPVAKRPTVIAYIWARTTLDAANLSKSVLDALQGIAYHNDASVTAVACVAQRSRLDQHGVIAVARLAPGTNQQDLHTALAALIAAAAPFTENL